MSTKAWELSVGLDELLGRTGLLMLKNVDELAEWIPDIEPPNAPRLTGGAVLYGNLGFLDSAQGLIKIVYLNGQVRYWSARAALTGKADLYCHFSGTRIRANPAMIHGKFKAKNVPIEIVRLRRLGRRNVGNDSFDFHVLPEALTACPNANWPNRLNL